MNLIDTNIQPDPFDPQRGDVYEFGAPFPQRLVVEDPPTAEDPRIRYRVDGGADSNLTTLGQFHLHLAGLGEIRGVGRVREYSPLTPDVCRTLIHRLRSTALGVDRPAGDLMRGAAATIEEQAAALARYQEHGDGVPDRLLLAWRLWIKARDPSLHDGLFDRELRRLFDEHQKESRRLTDTESGALAKSSEDCSNCDGLSRSLLDVANRYAELADAVLPSGRTGLEAATVVSVATRARRLAEQIRNAITILGCEFDDKADAGDELLRAVRQEREAASKMGVELDSISAFIAPHGVEIPAGEPTPTSMQLVRWLAVAGGVDPRERRPTIEEIHEAQRSVSCSVCTGFVTVLAVRDRIIIQRQSWTSDRPDFKATDLSFHDDDMRFATGALEFGSRQGIWTWRGSLGSFPNKQWQGAWTEETE